jgi:hypothetical protein
MRVGAASPTLARTKGLIVSSDANHFQSDSLLCIHREFPSAYTRRTRQFCNATYLRSEVRINGEAQHTGWYTLPRTSIVRVARAESTNNGLCDAHIRLFATASLRRRSLDCGHRRWDSIYSVNIMHGVCEMCGRWQVYLLQVSKLPNSRWIDGAAQIYIFSAEF